MCDLVLGNTSSSRRSLSPEVKFGRSTSPPTSPKGNGVAVNVGEELLEEADPTPVKSRVAVDRPTCTLLVPYPPDLELPK